jgi:hypothetical protein
MFTLKANGFKDYDLLSATCRWGTDSQRLKKNEVPPFSATNFVVVALLGLVELHLRLFGLAHIPSPLPSERGG